MIRPNIIRFGYASDQRRTIPMTTFPTRTIHEKSPQKHDSKKMKKVTTKLDETVSSVPLTQSFQESRQRTIPIQYEAKRKEEVVVAVHGSKEESEIENLTIPKSEKKSGVDFNVAKPENNIEARQIPISDYIKPLDQSPFEPLKDSAYVEQKRMDMLDQKQVRFDVDDQAKDSAVVSTADEMKSINTEYQSVKTDSIKNK